jgi:hypothetical protein
MAHSAMTAGDHVSPAAVTQSPTRAAAKANFLAKLQSLVFNPVEWLDAAEQRALMAARKLQTAFASMGAAGEASAPVFQIPYASAPYGQSLHWPAAKPLKFVQAGRILSVALRTHSDLFVEQVEVLARQHRSAIDEKLFGRIDKAFKESNFGAVLVCAGGARQYATTILARAVAEAEGWSRQFNILEAKEVLVGRQRQHREVAGFFSAVERGIVTDQQGQSSDANKEPFAMGACKGFFDELRAGRYNTELTKSTMKRGKALRGGDCAMSASSDKSGSSFSDSDSSCRALTRGRRRESKKRKGGGKSSGRGKGRDGSTRDSKVKCEFQAHFPCSKAIIGPELGVECSASGACRHCNKRGHWSGECPVGWAKAVACLPGYSEQGKRYVGEWDADRNPTKHTTKAWLDFLKSEKYFPGGGVAALERGALSLAYFRRWVGKAQK